MWGEIGKALNDTVLGGSIMPLNKIIEAESYNSYYNSMLSYMSAYGDNSGAIVIVPYGAQEVFGLETNTTAKTVIIPYTVTVIGESAFSGWTNLETVIIPKSVSTILGGAFYNCTALKTIYLPKSITALSSNVFNGCENLTDIYVGWGDGERSNSPWGAANAEIHYNVEG